jgi:hypothetical protein
MTPMMMALMATMLPAPAPEAQNDMASQPPQRIRNLQLRPGEECPTAAEGEIIVCGQLDEPYRIPREFRDPPPSPANTAWAVRSERLMEDGRVGLPDSCSPVGTGGLTGCNRQLLHQWGQGRAEQRRRDAGVP